MTSIPANIKAESVIHCRSRIVVRQIWCFGRPHRWLWFDHRSPLELEDEGITYPSEADNAVTKDNYRRCRQEYWITSTASSSSSASTLSLDFRFHQLMYSINILIRIPWCHKDGYPLRMKQSIFNLNETQLNISSCFKIMVEWSNCLYGCDVKWRDLAMHRNVEDITHPYVGKSM